MVILRCGPLRELEMLCLLIWVLVTQVYSLFENLLTCPLWFVHFSVFTQCFDTKIILKQTGVPVDPAPWSSPSHPSAPVGFPAYRPQLLLSVDKATQSIPSKYVNKKSFPFLITCPGISKEPETLETHTLPASGRRQLPPTTSSPSGYLYLELCTSLAEGAHCLWRQLPSSESSSLLWTSGDPRVHWLACLLNLLKFNEYSLKNKTEKGNTLSDLTCLNISLLHWHFKNQSHFKHDH